MYKIFQYRIFLFCYYLSKNLNYIETYLFYLKKIYYHILFEIYLGIKQFSSICFKRIIIFVYYLDIAHI